MMRFWAKIPSENADFNGNFKNFLVLAHNLLKVARRAGVPSGEARRVILVELTFWLILEIKKSIQKCHGVYNF